MHTVIFAGGTVRPGRAVNEAITTADYIIAADSGARTAFSYGLTPAVIVGDFDSLHMSEQEIRNRGSEFMRAPVEKDETDTELALQIGLERGATRITLLGALGGARFEHTIANVLLLTGFPDTPIHIVDGPSICWLLHGPSSTAISGQPDDLLSLFPLAGNATGVTTTNLYYPLHNDTLAFGKPRGVSNKLTSTEATVSLESGMLLVIYTNAEELHE